MSGKQKYTATACNVVWTEVSEDAPVVSFVKGRERAQTTCIRLSYGGSTVEGSAERVETP